MDAISILKEDHVKVKKLLAELDQTTQRALKTREEGLAKLYALLTPHEAIEEDVFYPALLEHPRAKDIVLEGYEEHHAANLLLDELYNVPFDDERWGPKFTVIKENIEHHIEEEEGDMFKKARQLLEPEELRALGERMLAEREAVKT